MGPTEMNTDLQRTKVYVCQPAVTQSVAFGTQTRTRIQRACTVTSLATLSLPWVLFHKHSIVE